MTKCVKVLRAKQSRPEPVIGPCFPLLCFARNTLTHVVMVTETNTSEAHSKPSNEGDALLKRPYTQMSSQHKSLTVKHDKLCLRVRHWRRVPVLRGFGGVRRECTRDVPHAVRAGHRPGARVADRPHGRGAGAGDGCGNQAEKVDRANRTRVHPGRQGYTSKL